MKAFKHFFFHCWSKDNKAIGKMLIQERRCEVCNAAERRIIRATIYDGVVS